MRGFDIVIVCDYNFKILFIFLDGLFKLNLIKKSGLYYIIDKMDVIENILFFRNFWNYF